MFLLTDKKPLLFSNQPVYLLKINYLHIYNHAFYWTGLIVIIIFVLCIVYFEIDKHYRVEMQPQNFIVSFIELLGLVST